jgi:hypothetical protein
MNRRDFFRRHLREFLQEGDMCPVIHDSAEWRNVKNQVDLIAVATELFGEPVERRGNTLHWRCPFCDGVESLQITVGRPRWRCLACSQFGDGVDLVRATLRTTFSGALRYLSDPKFYQDAGDIRGDSPVTIGEMLDAGESLLEYDDNWVENLLKGE